MSHWKEMMIPKFATSPLQWRVRNRLVCSALPAFPSAVISEALPDLMKTWGGEHPVCLRIHRSIGGAKKPLEALIILQTWEIPLKAVVSGHHEATHTSCIVYSEAHFPMCLFVFRFGWTGMWKVLKRVFCQKKNNKLVQMLMKSCKCHSIRGKRG